MAKLTYDYDDELAWIWIHTYDLALHGDAAIDHYYCDETLEARSALEFVRDTLTAEQIKVLDDCDALWQANPEPFNACFAYHHARKNRDTDLDGWVWDTKDNTPRIPRSHWWWWPLAKKQEVKK